MYSTFLKDMQNIHLMQFASLMLLVLAPVYLQTRLYWLESEDLWVPENKM